jgi:hypothetical protein
VTIGTLLERLRTLAIDAHSPSTETLEAHSPDTSGLALTEHDFVPAGAEVAGLGALTLDPHDPDTTLEF